MLQGCGGVLRDNLLDWNDELPEAEFDRATRACKEEPNILSLHK